MAEENNDIGGEIEQPLHDKLFVLKTNPILFSQTLGWIKKQNLVVTGYHEIQSKLGFIKSANNDIVWKNMYGFSRCVTVVMRHYMLLLTELKDDWLPTECKSVENNGFKTVKITNSSSPYNTKVNAGKILAKNENEAQWVSAHFDMLLPHFHITNLYSSLKDVGNTQSQPFQMVVINIRHNAVWQFIGTLKVTRRQLPRGTQKGECLEAVPFLAVIRMERKDGKNLDIYPSPATNEDDEVEKMIDEMKKLCLP